MDLTVSLVWCWTGADWTTTKIGIFNLGLEQKSTISLHIKAANSPSSARLPFQSGTVHAPICNCLSEADDTVKPIAAPPPSRLC